MKTILNLENDFLSNHHFLIKKIVKFFIHFLHKSSNFIYNNLVLYLGMAFKV